MKLDTDKVQNLDIGTPINVIDCHSNYKVDEQLLTSSTPVLLKGLVSHWPVVKAANHSNNKFIQYVKGLYSGVPIIAARGAPEINARIAYSDDLKELNCKAKRSTLDTLFDEILSAKNTTKKPVHYMGTTPVDFLLPGFTTENTLDIGLRDAAVNMWIGNQSCIPTHYDFPDNIACTVAGRRKFTLFPPDQLKNLYVGPIDFTPAGRAIGLEDIRNPDFERFPKLREAFKFAQVAELDAGDALFIPSMWWHNVEALDDVNALVNYWWCQSEAFVNSPEDLLELAILCLRDLPKEQKESWKGILDYYVFEHNDEQHAHIPEYARGCLGPSTELNARKLRAKLLSHLNR
ncbi:MAG: hypothetical protein ACI93R_000017 [Flavobacteriales bacterium]|jgi:hypothetical protein